MSTEPPAGPAIGSPSALFIIDEITTVFHTAPAARLTHDPWRDRAAEKLGSSTPIRWPARCLALACLKTRLPGQRLFPPACRCSARPSLCAAFGSLSALRR